MEYSEETAGILEIESLSIYSQSKNDGNLSRPSRFNVKNNLFEFFFLRTHGQYFPGSHVVQ